MNKESNTNRVYEDLEDLKRTFTDKYPAHQHYPLPPYHPQDVCPNCGYCPHCGRGYDRGYRFHWYYDRVTC